MLQWLRLRKPEQRVRRIAARPVQILDSRRPSLMGPMWQSSYCCTLLFFWIAVVTEHVCQNSLSQSDKRKVMRKVLARIAGEMGGTQTRFMSRVLPNGHPRRRRALADLKRVVDLYRGNVDDRFMLYADYRDAVNGGGRPARTGNRWGLRTEAAHEILLVSYVIDTLRNGQEFDQPHATS
jgi:hypothetical protein